MLATRVLLVDGDEVVHMTLAGVPEQSGFAITSAANARESLGLIAGGESYDALLSDRHLPGSGSGDALTVVSGMRHANPGACDTAAERFSSNDRSILSAANRRDSGEGRRSHLTRRCHQAAAGQGPQNKQVIDTAASMLQRETTNTIRVGMHVSKRNHR